MDTVFFIIAKAVGYGLRVETWLIVIMALATVAAWRGQRRAATMWGLSACGLLLGLSVLPVGGWIIAPLERDHPPALRVDLPEADGIIILGGVEDYGATDRWGPMQTNKAAERVAAGFALARAQPQARVVFTGGRGLRAGATQGPYPPLQQFLYDQGVASDRITLEYQSRNTAENARLSHALLSPNTDETWILVTSAFHMTRALNSFDAAGWPKMIPYPVDYRSGTPTRRGAGWTIDTVNTALKEYVGRIAYRWSGR